MFFLCFTGQKKNRTPPPRVPPPRVHPTTPGQKVQGSKILGKTSILGQFEIFDSYKILIFKIFDSYKKKFLISMDLKKS